MSEHADLALARSVVRIERNALERLEASLGNTLLDAVELILATDRHVVVAGVGKSPYRPKDRRQPGVPVDARLAVIFWPIWPLADTGDDHMSVRAGNQFPGFEPRVAAVHYTTLTRSADQEDPISRVAPAHKHLWLYE